jgi:hypothetical protein
MQKINVCYDLVYSCTCGKALAPLKRICYDVIWQKAQNHLNDTFTIHKTATRSSTLRSGRSWISPASIEDIGNRLVSLALWKPAMMRLTVGKVGAVWSTNIAIALVGPYVQVFDGANSAWLSSAWYAENWRRFLLRAEYYRFHEEIFRSTCEYDSWTVNVLFVLISFSALGRVGLGLLSWKKKPGAWFPGPTSILFYHVWCYNECRRLRHGG